MSVNEDTDIDADCNLSYLETPTVQGGTVYPSAHSVKGARLQASKMSCEFIVSLALRSSTLTSGRMVQNREYHYGPSYSHTINCYLPGIECKFLDQLLVRCALQELDWRERPGKKVRMFFYRFEKLLRPHERLVASPGRISLSTMCRFP